MLRTAGFVFETILPIGSCWGQWYKYEWYSLQNNAVPAFRNHSTVLRQAPDRAVRFGRITYEFVFSALLTFIYLSIRIS